jgi:hypothetical protein
MCSNGGSTRYNGQIMHQPAWTLWDMIQLADVEPTAAGYRIAPHLPFPSYALRLPRVGLEVTPASIRGYVSPESGASLVMSVAVPQKCDPARVATWVGGRRIRHDPPVHGTVTFRLRTSSGQAADWAVPAGRSG